MVSEFDQFVLKSMPHFIAVQYQRLLESKTAEQKIRYALHVYELGLRALTLGVVSQYLIRDAERVSDPALNQLFLTKLPNATLDIWQKILFSTLSAYEGLRHLFFMPELYDFFWDSSTMPPQPRQSIEVPFTRLIQIRNDLEYGTPPTGEAGWQTLYTETLGLLHTILSQFAFFENYDLIHITKRDGDLYWYDRYTGLETVPAQTPLQTHRELGTGWFYLSKQNLDFLCLHPLLVFWEEPRSELTVSSPQERIAVYDRFIRERLQYLVTSLWATVTDEKSVADFVRLLYHTVEQIKREEQEVERLTWRQLQELARVISQQRMANVLSKYRSDLYLQRDKTQAAFEDFLASDKVCFILTGKSGVGKSNFLLALSEAYGWEHSSDVCLLMYNGAKLSPEEPLTAIVGRDFDNHLQLIGQSVERGIADIWREIARINDIERRKVILLIDAVNENAEAKALLRRIDELVEGSLWPWLKVVVTSRPETWRAIKQGVRLAEARYYREAGEEKLGVEMEPFSYSQELEPFTRNELPLAYDKYREVYDLRTVYFDLPSQVKTALQDPLVLRLVADIHQGQEIPSTIKMGDIYQGYINHLVRTERLTETDLRFLERELMPLMIREGHYANAIMAREIDEALTTDGRSLFELIHSEGKLSNGRWVSQSYINLVDGDILIRHGEAQDYEIRFKYERFYDYFAGKRLFQMHHGTPDSYARYAALVDSIKQQAYLWGGTKAALIMDLEHANQELILELCKVPSQSMREVMIAVLSEYGREYLEPVRYIIDRLMELYCQQTSGLLSPITDFWRRDSQPLDDRTLSAAVISLEVARHLEMTDVLQKAAVKAPESVRVQATQNIYHLWRANPAAGMTTLDGIANQAVGVAGLPRMPAVESCLGISMLLLSHYEPQESSRVLVTSIVDIWRNILTGVLYLHPSGRARAALGRFIRKIVLRAIIRFAMRQAEQLPENRPSFIRDAALFFKSPPSIKERYNRLVSFFAESPRSELKTISDDLFAAVRENDAMTSAVVFLIVVVQGMTNRRETLSLVRKLFDHALSQPRVGLYAMNFPGAIGQVGLHYPVIDDEVYTLCEEMLMAYLDKTKGVFYSNLSVAHTNVLLGEHGRMRKARVNPNDKDLHTHYLNEAIQRQDWQFLDLLLFDLVVQATVFENPEGALKSATAILPPAHEHVKNAVVDLLARTRLYYPDLVRDFLEEHEHELDDETRRLVNSRIVVEHPWGNFMQYKFMWLMVRTLQSATIRKEVASLLARAPYCRDLSEFAEFAIKRVVNLVYGVLVFPE